MDFGSELKKCKKIGDVFELVKKIVTLALGKDQAGLLVGLSDLGAHPNAFVGAFYSLNSNMIIINKKPLKRIQRTNQNLYIPYIFHILLHEYIHSLGFYNERETRILTYQISRYFFGEDHVVTELAVGMERFMPNLVYPSYSFQPPEDYEIEFVSGIDRDNTRYIM